LVDADSISARIRDFAAGYCGLFITDTARASTLMKIALCSTDPELERMCSELVAQMPEHTCSLASLLPGEPAGEADLYIWDLEPRNWRPEEVDRCPVRHLFLVDNEDLAGFHASPGASDANILLKPVTQAALRAFLILAISAHEERVAAVASLREDRDEILQCLIQANLKLQEYDQDRANFLARAIHDFRAPLTALNGYCGLLLSEPLASLSEYQKEALRRMEYSASRLSRITNSIFQLSVAPRLKGHGTMQLNTIPECIERALSEVVHFVDEKRISVSVELSADPPPLYCERAQIEQLLINLLDNACKFTPKGGAIEIRGYPYFWERRQSRHQFAVAEERRVGLLQEPNAFRLDVRESAKQIPPQQLESIFEEYTSYGSSEDRSGGGLGLAICKMVVCNHFGRIWAENTDFGPMFSVVLPLPDRFGQLQRNGHAGDFLSLGASQSS
jgi:signal transduction histidine kinase